MNEIFPDRTEQGEAPEEAVDRTEENAVDRTEQALREALGTLADGVHAAPDAYRTARGDWRRRERRRRIVLALLVAVVFTVAVAIGLWVLNQAPAGNGAIFTEPAAAAVHPDGRG